MADKPPKAEKSFDEVSSKINIFKHWKNICNWFLASYLGFYFARKLVGKPFFLVFYLFLQNLLVHLPLVILFLQSDFLQSQNLLGFPGGVLKFPLYGKDTNGLTPNQNTILMCPRKVMALTGIVTGATNPREAWPNFTRVWSVLSVWMKRMYGEKN